MCYYQNLTSNITNYNYDCGYNNSCYNYSNYESIIDSKDETDIFVCNFGNYTTCLCGELQMKL